MRGFSAEARRKNQTIALVPTMGFLHEGHLSLIRIGKGRCDIAVVSSYVNPTQFGPGEDLASYPRDSERDRRLCEKEGTDILFRPETGEMYAQDNSTWVDEADLSRGLCGRLRPGHFRGVTTVVAKLFNIVLPHVAVFGQKDAQQVCVVRRMTRDLCFPVEIVVAPIVREPDGLAMSSRNTYLSPGERKDALCLFRALERAKDLYAEGQRDAGKIRQGMIEIVNRTPSAQIDYVEIVDFDTLKAVTCMEKTVLAAVAVKIGRTRLIDNVVIRPGAERPGLSLPPLP